MEPSVQRDASHRDRMVVAAVCFAAGVALIGVAWRLVQQPENPVTLSALLFMPSVLPRGVQIGYFVALLGAAIAVGRSWVGAYALLLPHVGALVHVCAVATARRPPAHVDYRVWTSFGIALDVGRGSVVAGLLCAGLVWWLGRGQRLRSSGS